MRDALWRFCPIWQVQYMYAFCFLASTVCIFGRHSWIPWGNGFPPPTAHLAHAELLRLPPLTLFAPEDNQSSAVALEPTVFSVLHTSKGVK